MTIAVTSSALDVVLQEATAHSPHEACGLLFGTDRTITEARPAANIHPDPATHFEIDPRSLIDAHRAMRSGGPRLVGYYHSHPHGPPAPSATDRARAAADGMIWAIAGEGRVALWRAAEDGFEPLPYRLAPA